MTGSARPSTRPLAALAGLALLAAAVLLPLTAAAQPRDRTRRVLLSADSDYWIRGVYGGDMAAEELAPGCVGWVSMEPDVIIEVDSGIWAHLRVDVPDGTDTTLTLRSDRHGTICNDDADAVSVEPEIVTFLRPGRYFVHVGAKEPLLEGRFRVRVAEASDDSFPLVTEDRTLRLQGVSGGSFDAAEHADSCVGAIPGRASHVVRLDRPGLLYVGAASNSDLTLLVIDQDGTVYCNDDAEGTLDPRMIRTLPEGLVRIYVGSHNPGVNAYYNLTVEMVTSG